MSASAWQFELLANVGCADEAVVDAAVLELVLATLELDAAGWLELVLDPPPLDPPQPAISAATVTIATNDLI